jgi:tetratricopeptide (TPR) repeat protein
MSRSETVWTCRDSVPKGELEMMDLDAAFDHVRHLLDAEDYANALTEVEAALAADPQDTDVLYLKVLALLGLKRYAEALPLSVQLLTSSSTDEGKWLALCSSLRALGYVELALQINAHALQQITAPDYELARFGGDTLFRQHRNEEALDAYQPALTQFGQQALSWPIWYNYALCLSEVGHTKEAQEANRLALKSLQRLLATGSVTSERYLVALWRHEGIVMARLGQWTVAEQVLTRSMRADTDNFETAFWLHTTYRALHKPISAALFLPWVVWNHLAKQRRDDKEEQNLLEQRRSVPQTTLEHIRALIAS